MEFQWFWYLCVLRPWRIKILKDKIICGMCPVGCKDRSINLNMCICKNNPVRLISVAVIIMAVVYKDAYFF